MASGGKPGAVLLPRQHNLQTAADKALAALRAQPSEQLAWLGAQCVAGRWRVPVLDDRLAVDLATGRVTTEAGVDVSPQWRILVLHYLGVAARPAALPPEVAFADLASARSYAGVYHARVVGRLCATVGRQAEPLRAAAAGLGAVPAPGGDVAFDLAPFPRLTVRLIWHAPDEEFAPSATLLFAPNVELFFCIEDVVVISERLVSRLSGRPF